MSGYRPPSTEPRGKWARAIHAKRRELGLSQTGGFEVLGERLGLGPKSRAAYVAIDLGQRLPTDAEAAVIADWLGGYPADDMETSGSVLNAGPDVSSYLTRIDSLVGTVSELVAELRATRRDRDDLSERVEALEAAARLRDSRDGAAGGGTTAPLQTRG